MTIPRVKPDPKGNWVDLGRWQSKPQPTFKDKPPKTQPEPPKENK